MLFNLKDRALARAQRRLAPMMEPGETVLAFDICQGGAGLGEILSRRGPRVHVGLSDKALYLVHVGGYTDRLPLAEIADVGFRGFPDPNDLIASAAYASDRLARLVTIHLWDGRSIALMPMGRRAPAMFGPDLKARVPDRTMSEYHVDLGDGRGVKVVQRRGRPGAIGFDWDYVQDPGTDVDTEPLRSVFDQKMRQLMREAGDPNADASRP